MEKDYLMNESNPQEVLQTPSIKITKNSKGYNFEFRITSLDMEELDKVHKGIINKIQEWESEYAN